MLLLDVAADPLDPAPDHIGSAKSRRLGTNTVQTMRVRFIDKEQFVLNSRLIGVVILTAEIVSLQT